MRQDKRELNQIKKGRLNLDEIEEMGLSESFEEFKEKQIQRRENEKKILNKMSLKSAGTSLLALGAGVGLALLIPAASSVIGGIAMLTAGYKGLEALSVATHMRASTAMDFNKSYANQNEFMKTLSEDQKSEAKEKYDEMTERLDAFGEPLANAIKNSEKFMNMKMDKKIEALQEAKLNLELNEPVMEQQEITMDKVDPEGFKAQQEFQEHLDKLEQPLADMFMNSETFMEIDVEERIEYLKKAKIHQDKQNPPDVNAEILSKNPVDTFDNCNVSEEREKELMDEISNDINNKKHFEEPKDKSVTHKQKNTI